MRVIWATMMGVVVSGVHYYFWHRLVKAPALPQPWRLIATLVLIGFALLIPLSFALGRMSLPWLRDSVMLAAFSWFGFIGILFVLLVDAELLRGLALLSSRLGGPGPDLADPTRRLLLSRIIAGGVSLTALGLSATGLALGARAPTLKSLRVKLRRLPEKLSGMRVIQISDVHLGQPIGGEYLAEVVRRINAREPDLVAITGDLVDGDTSLLREMVAPLAQLRARHGVFFVTGNHEYYSGVEPWLELLRGMGIRVLRNEHLRVGEGDDTLVVAGTDDHQGKRFAPGHGPDLQRALEGVRPDEEVLLLAHRPRQIHQAAERGVGLQLSGHTHGGQMWPMTMFIGLAEPYTEGLHRHGESQIYVNTGTGVWGPPMRLGSESEITELELLRG